MGIFKQFEEKWQKAWEEARIFEADPISDKPKYFITVAYPYPNSPQHIGHGRTYTLADVHARYMRMRGYNVLLPMAFHYTGTPILAMIKRLNDGDEDLIDTFTRIYHVPKETLKHFVEPIKIARYFHEEIKQGMKEIGYSMDWRREFITVDPEYSRFIEWQFHKLRHAGLISQGSHPVGWCPNDGNPVGQHDTRGDVEPEIGEYVLVKFEYDGYVLPAATLRPETVFGVTNMWLNPKAEYVKATVNGEQWIVSKQSVQKLRYLNRKVEVLETFIGKEMIGKQTSNPVNHEDMLILPADFVDPNNATGVVMSVPGHAPYDYIALEQMKKETDQLEEYGIKPEALESVKPISIISVPKYGEFPAADAVNQTGIKDQRDARLEDATKEIYRHEFHVGTMKKNTGSYAGLSVAEAKERVRQDLITDGKAETMYELVNKPVVCRCGTECLVKMFEDQWFINYGDPKWKDLAHKCLDEMSILPEDLRQEFNYVIDWLHEKACARKAGLGTKLPWDPQWVIESLSDSVIYMAYYLIVKHIKQYRIRPEQLTKEVFDYIFLGVGLPKRVATQTGINEKVLEEMRNEFKYFYPLDSRHSGRDLVPNHLTFMVFVHVGIFSEELWPRQIVVNGSVLMEGQKMSKSMGNIIPLRDAVKMFGADPLRMAELTTAELLQDADFSPTLARSMGDRLEKFYKFAVEATQMEESASASFSEIDRWIISRLQDHIKMATESMDKLLVRRAVHSVFYMLDQDFQWYRRRISKESGVAERKKAIVKVFRKILDSQVRMLAPIAPHVCEEIWEKMGGKGFVSLALWPTPEEAKVDVEAEEAENLIQRVFEDTLNIIEATGISPKQIYYYVSASWKWQVYLKVLKKSVSAKIVFGDIIKELMADHELKVFGEKVVKFTRQAIDETNQISGDKKDKQDRVGIMNEYGVLKGALGFLEGEFKAKVLIYVEDDQKRYDPKKKAELSRPHRPAIYIE